MKRFTAFYMVSAMNPSRVKTMAKHAIAAVITFFVSGVAPQVTRADFPFLDADIFSARDTLACRKDSSEDARSCVDGLSWQPTEFPVRCESPLPFFGDALVSFPSPIKSGDPTNDRVTMEWYLARDERNDPLQAPAVVVVHESGSDMPVGRIFAMGFQASGLHAFMIHLPYYGPRRTGGVRPSGDRVVHSLRQGVADVRRARDAVAALPYIQNGNISLQGTSLGGFVGATCASLDSGSDTCGYKKVFLLLAGGHLADVLRNGERDAAKFREQLERSGLSWQQIEAAVLQVEPTRIAHRLNPERTWLYSGQYDQVVPIKNALALAESARLAPAHHQQLPFDHYSGALHLPILLSEMVAEIKRD